MWVGVIAHGTRINLPREHGTGSEAGWRNFFPGTFALRCRSLFRDERSASLRWHAMLEWRIGQMFGAHERLVLK
jgi:hypothetical protein